ncbi:hypothetical protein J2W21_000354 [Sinomonas atrocyanea]|uniref:hypothetical protein n=1 Tax=Sinomonas atrocyanea TaxID=37927 RepID=UPI002787DD82|nr:hypothetical protein [Sinomonas atrocyanea]MDP9882875.1 hypothetical protein [Sinomonas atrocyanea]
MKRTQVQAVLAEEGLEHDAALTAALERIAALRLAEPPTPTGELARLLAGGSAGESTTAPLAVVLPLTRAAARKSEAAAAPAKPHWIKRHRGAMIGVLVAAGMGLGASGVAAMTGQVWDWHAPLHPAVGPSLTHAAEPSAPGGTAHTSTPTGVPPLPQDAGAAGAATGPTATGHGADREAGSSDPGRDAGATPAARDARDQGRDAQEQAPQDRGRQGSGRGPTDSARPSQGPQQPGDRGASGQDGDGREAGGQDASR